MNSETVAIIGAVSSLIQAIVVVAGIIFALLQLKEMNASRSVDALSRVLDELSSPDMNEARRYVYTQELPSPENLPSEVHDILHKVWISFDKVGLMVSFKLVPERIVLEMYYMTIIMCWKRLKPYILYEREMRGGRYQEYFQDLYRRAILFRNKYYPEERGKY